MVKLTYETVAYTRRVNKGADGAEVRKTPRKGKNADPFAQSNAENLLYSTDP